MHLFGASKCHPVLNLIIKLGRGRIGVNMPNSDCVRLIEESHWMANYGIVRFLGGELTLYYLFGCFREHSEVMIKKKQ